MKVQDFKTSLYWVHPDRLQARKEYIKTHFVALLYEFVLPEVLGLKAYNDFKCAETRSGNGSKSQLFLATKSSKLCQNQVMLAH